MSRSQNQIGRVRLETEIVLDVGIIPSPREKKFDEKFDGIRLDENR